MELTVFDQSVYELVDPAAPMEKLAGGFTFTEGPVFVDGIVYFTDFMVNKIFTYHDGVVTLIDDHSDFSIGLAYDRKRKKILRCTRERRAITDMEGNVIVGHYNGVPINGSNDVVVDSAGRVYFSDPLSRVLEGEQIGHSSVFCYDEDAGVMTMLEGTLGRPNGLALTPDEKHLYIIDSNEFSLYIMDLATREMRLFITLDQSYGTSGPDGMRVDKLGNVYTTGPGGVWLVNPDGKALGIIHTPENAANLCFDAKGLFITASTGIYRVDIKIPSAV
jgi:gluconolactonase